MDELITINTLILSTSEFPHLLNCSCCTGNLNSNKVRPIGRISFSGTGVSDISRWERRIGEGLFIL